MLGRTAAVFRRRVDLSASPSFVRPSRWNDNECGNTLWQIDAPPVVGYKVVRGYLSYEVLRRRSRRAKRTTPKAAVTRESTKRWMVNKGAEWFSRTR
jgi:hypothetical protein